MQTFKGKLKLNKLQKQQIDDIIVGCTELNNEILTLSFTENSLPNYNKLGMFYSLIPEVPSAIAQQQIKRTCQAIIRWKTEDNSGKKFGKPRFKTPKVKTNSFCFPVIDDNTIKHYGNNISVKIPKVGWIKGRISSRKIEGKIKHISVKVDSCGDYWMSIVTDNERKVELPEPKTKVIGVDLGIKTTINASNKDGTIVIQPERKKFLDEKNLNSLKYASNKDRKQLPFVYRKIARRRDDYNWKLARKVVASSECIFVGNVSVKWLFSGKLARRAADIGLFSLKRKMLHLAASAGRCFEEINEAYTSKMCSCCSNIKEELKLSDRVFVCSCCGFVLDRDLNAARNIAKRGEQQRLEVGTNTSCIGFTGNPAPLGVGC